ncbi:MAG: D-2-hydroxyacid dehydrogenase [Anaerolineae bacterium]|nr:D-2-hydroxyacid dehydrogenase [Anaerolineae bacterium]
MAEEPIHVVVALDFSDEIMDQLRAVSPRLHIERHFPKVPDSAWADAEILYTVRELPDPDQAPRLRWIQAHTAGINHLLHSPIMQAEDVEITTASGIHAVPIAEYCLSMMLAFAYRLPTLRGYQERADWPANSWDFKTQTLRGQTLGIVGYGSIGRELARLADAMGMVVVATKRDLKQISAEGEYIEAGLGDETGDIPTRLYPPEALASMVKVCDFVVLTLPLTDSTRHIVNEDILSAMKKTAVLVNVSRGGVVDEAALISALAAEKIAGAGLDVFETEPLPATSPLWQLDQVVITPHISGNNGRIHEKAAALFAENLQRYLDNEPLLNQFDRQRGY